jgi:peptide/nickel transport system substrate-binding protein
VNAITQEGRRCRTPACIVAALLALSIGVGGAHARTLRLADQGDAISMDPHSLNDGLQLSLTGNVYEGLTARGPALELVPGLAREWRRIGPTTWRFALRPGVRFHDGAPFDADDVVFSLRRAAAPGSDMRAYVGLVADVRRIDALTVDIETTQPAPILPEMLSLVYMMDREWCEAHGATEPVDKRKGIENAASFSANGTGPYRLRSRDPGVRTEFERNPGYWGTIDGNVERVAFTPIGNDATRVAALVSGEIDLMQPVPVRDIPRVRSDPKLRVLEGPELRTIFLGMDVASEALRFSDVDGRNPFRDRRVRLAMYQAIDVDAIVRRIMRGAARPAALLVGPGVNGYDASLDGRHPYDPESARRLLAEAGYPDGFEVRMDCPNDRYVNDGEVCQAIAAMLAKIGIRIRLDVQTKAIHFPKILARNTSLFMLGWTPATYDAHNALYNLVATPDGSGQGQFNLGGYSNPEIDALVRAIASESDESRRRRLIAEAMRLHRDDVGHLPLHQQVLAWGMRRNVRMVLRADNFVDFKWISID